LGRGADLRRHRSPAGYGRVLFQASAWRGNRDSGEHRGLPRFERKSGLSARGSNGNLLPGTRNACRLLGLRMSPYRVQSSHEASRSRDRVPKRTRPSCASISIDVQDTGIRQDAWQVRNSAAGRYNLLRLPRMGRDSQERVMPIWTEESHQEAHGWVKHTFQVSGVHAGAALGPFAVDNSD